MLFLSQRPYLPQGTLRQAAYYPAAPQEGDASQVEHYFKLVGLEHLIPHLDETDIWSHILSLGEQQRVAIVRALLNRPAILFLDEATSAMDEQNELIAKHDRVLTYEGAGAYQIAPSASLSTPA